MSRRSAEKARKRRRIFREQSGLCYWCRQPMVIVEKQDQRTDWPNDMATFEHLDPKGDPNRGRIYHQRRIVLACYKCNHERGIRTERENNP